MLDDDLQMVKNAVVAFSDYKSAEYRAFKRIKKLCAEALKPSHNSAMVPCECVHGVSLEHNCNGCSDAMGSGRRVIAQHQ